MLKLPIPIIRQLGPAASHALLVEGDTDSITFYGVDEALKDKDVEVRLFGKPEVRGQRRMGLPWRGGTQSRMRCKLR